MPGKIHSAEGADRSVFQRIQQRRCYPPRAARTRTQGNLPPCPEHFVQHHPYEGYPVCPDCGRYRENDGCNACGFSPK